MTSNDPVHRLSQDGRRTGRALIGSLQQRASVEDRKHRPECLSRRASGGSRWPPRIRRAAHRGRSAGSGGRALTPSCPRRGREEIALGRPGRELDRRRSKRHVILAGHLVDLGDGALAGFGRRAGFGGGPARLGCRLGRVLTRPCHVLADRVDLGRQRARRDARGGRLTIATSNVLLDEADAAGRGNLKPGWHAQLGLDGPLLQKPVGAADLLAQLAATLAGR